MSIDYTSLERFAVMRIRPTLATAHGTCLHATMELAAEARRLGLHGHACVVRWCVRQDSEFLEHWALLLENGRVLDTTATQVDGDSRALRKLDEYPESYQRPRSYPIETVLGVIDNEVLTADDRYPRQLIWKLHRHLFQHDARKAALSMAPRELYKAFAAILRCGIALSISCLIESAVARANTLAHRIN